MKDWYLGNSWAGGIARAYPNGRNQESSSESIAAYEAISMFGKVMVRDVCIEWSN
jgi:endoglucanase Acf2